MRSRRRRRRRRDNASARSHRGVIEHAASVSIRSGIAALSVAISRYIPVVVSSQTIAGAISRKVRAPQGKSPGNAWARESESRRVTDSATEKTPPMAFGLRQG
jgi:hypothetical protein